jgi:beta-lactamase regulating signal transducer with metallopeptidase domain
MAWLLTWLVHGLAIALVTRFALRALPGLSAATRYAMWWAALVLVLILPIVRGLAIGAGRGAGASMSVDVSAVPGASSSPSLPPSSSSFENDFASTKPAAFSLTRFSLPPVPLPRVPDWFLSIVIGLWLGAAMLGLAQVVYSVQAVRQLKSSCRRMLLPRESDLPMWSAVRDLGRAVSVRASDRVRTAAVLGLTRPVIAVPWGAGAALTPHEIDQVVLHEYAHVQRYDDWTKLLQVLIGAFAGWHPAVRMMMREIDFEREAACDDYVVDVTGAPRAYARCLTKVIEMMPGSSLDLAAVPYAYSSTSHAATRIERLLDRKRPSGRLAVMPAMAGTVTLAMLAFCTVHALPLATDLPRVHESEALARGGDSRPAAEVGTEIGAEAQADETRDANVVEADARHGGLATAAATRSPRNEVPRIVAASTFPIALPFSFSPLSRLTETRPAAPSTTPSVLAPASARLGDVSAASFAPSTPGIASAAESRAPSHRAEEPATPVAHEPRRIRDAAAPRAETTFALGPVVAAGDSAAIPEASEAGHISRAWESTRDATSKAVGTSARAVGTSARAVGTATKTAGGATKTATGKAAAGVKASGAKTARAIKRTFASVF